MVRGPTALWHQMAHRDAGRYVIHIAEDEILPLYSQRQQILDRGLDLLLEAIKQKQGANIPLQQHIRASSFPACAKFIPTFCR